MASGTYKVSTDPVEGRTYDNAKGNNKLTVWRLGLEGVQSTAEDGLFELHKIQGNQPPPKGTALELKSSKEGEHGGEKFTRLFLADTYQVGGGGSSSGGGARQKASGEGPGLRWQDKPYQSSATHPRDEVRMIRTSALSSAPTLITQMVGFGVEAAPKDWDSYWKLVARTVDRVEQAYAARLRAYDDEVSGRIGGTGEVPADTRGL